MENTNFTQLPPSPQPPVENKKLVVGLCALMVGTFGVHKFILGYTTEGIIYLLLNLLIIPVLGVITCGFGFGLYAVTGGIAMVEGIIYLTKTDEDFYQTYQVNKKAWF